MGFAPYMIWFIAPYSSRIFYDVTIECGKIWYFSQPKWHCDELANRARDNSRELTIATIKFWRSTSIFYATVFSRDYYLNFFFILTLIFWWVMPLQVNNHQREHLSNIFFPNNWQIMKKTNCSFGGLFNVIIRN